MNRNYLVVSDFDQTLSFNDSGKVLSEMLGVSDFHEKVAGLARSHLVQQGAELAYLLRHDPAFRQVREADLIEAGRRVSLKRNIKQFADFLQRGLEGVQFHFCVISAAPQAVVRSALEGLVPSEHVFGTELEHDHSGEICNIRKVTAGYGKVALLMQLEHELKVRPDHVVYIGDGSSDLHVMQYVNQHDGLTISVSESELVSRTARRTVLGDNALSVLVPILEEIADWQPGQIRDLFDHFGLVLRDWSRARTDWLTITPGHRLKDAS